MIHNFLKTPFIAQSVCVNRTPSDQKKSRPCGSHPSISAAVGGENCIPLFTRIPNKIRNPNEVVVGTSGKRLARITNRHICTHIFFLTLLTGGAVLLIQYNIVKLIP